MYRLRHHENRPVRAQPSETLSFIHARLTPNELCARRTYVASSPCRIIIITIIVICRPLLRRIRVHLYTYIHVYLHANLYTKIILHGRSNDDDLHFHTPAQTAECKRSENNFQRPITRFGLTLRSRFGFPRRRRPRHNKNSIWWLSSFLFIVVVVVLARKIVNGPTGVLR